MANLTTDNLCRTGQAMTEPRTRAFQEGREDFIYPSELRSRNPYGVGTVDADQWDAGRAEAKADVEASKVQWEREAFGRS